MDQDIQLLHQKIDHLTAQMDAQRLQERGWDELKRDAIPIANHMVKLTIDELAEIDGQHSAGNHVYRFCCLHAGGLGFAWGLWVGFQGGVGIATRPTRSSRIPSS